MRFTKMHALGNDYVYVDGFRDPLPADPAAAAVKVSRFHTGIGSDGLILIEPCEGYDARMRIFNADGSEAEMCGNGLRCVAKYLHDEGHAKDPVIRVLTGAGLRTAQVLPDGTVRAGMGMPLLLGSLSLTVPNAGPLTFYRVSAGNPHAVTFDAYEEGSAFYEDGRAVETDRAFPEGTNVEFVRVSGENELDVRVWERGSGATLACGTGACAVLAAAYSLKKTGPSAVIRLPGGPLKAELDPGTGEVSITGEAVRVFTGEWTEI